MRWRELRDNLLGATVLLVSYVVMDLVLLWVFSTWIILPGPWPFILARILPLVFGLLIICFLAWREERTATIADKYAHGKDRI